MSFANFEKGAKIGSAVLSGILLTLEFIRLVKGDGQDTQSDIS